MSMISTIGIPACANMACAASVCSSPAIITPDGRHDSISYNTASSRSGEQLVTPTTGCRPVSSSTSEMPVITSGKTMFDSEGIITPTRFTRWLASAPAILFGT